jgi:hypothetical protein
MNHPMCEALPKACSIQPMNPILPEAPQLSMEWLWTAWFGAAA